PARRHLQAATLRVVMGADMGDPRIESDGTRELATRRAFLRAGTAGMTGLWLGRGGLAQGAAPSGSPPARSVILLWLWGGPSHLDTFDMKPDAPLEYRGPFE